MQLITKQNRRQRNKERKASSTVGDAFEKHMYFESCRGLAAASKINDFQPPLEDLLFEHPWLWALAGRSVSRIPQSVLTPNNLLRIGAVDV